MNLSCIRLTLTGLLSLRPPHPRPVRAARCCSNRPPPHLKGSLSASGGAVQSAPREGPRKAEPHQTVHEDTESRRKRTSLTAVKWGRPNLRNVTRKEGLTYLTT